MPSSALDRRGAVLLLASAAALGAARPALAVSPAIPLELWKMRGCSCCEAWAQHMREAGFVVTTHEVDDVDPHRAAAGVPAALTGCHTARTAGGYVVEGHVPAGAVLRLLAERPPGVLGLAVPGMPVGSPGMEVEGNPGDPYDVLAFARDGSWRVVQAVRP